jgi:hypothetical protein
MWRIGKLSGRTGRDCARGQAPLGFRSADAIGAVVDSGEASLALQQAAVSCRTP